tara:strand:+ start:138 stop:299 length:162 start_codon:yes stop_codon:yes gene_type:complete
MIGWNENAVLMKVDGMIEFYVAGVNEFSTALVTERRHLVNAVVALRYRINPFP